MKKVAITIALLCVATFAQQKGTFKDPRDNKSYPWVKIGEQVWMAKNLDFRADLTTGELTKDKNAYTYCFGSQAANCDKYGYFYSWARAMNFLSPQPYNQEADCEKSSCASKISAKHKGICPEGWHIPSRVEWETMLKFVDPSCSVNEEGSWDLNCPNAGKLLKATSGWKNEGKKSGNGKDTFGFKALPAGWWYSQSDWQEWKKKHKRENIGLNTSWWSADEVKNRGANAYGFSVVNGEDHALGEGRDEKSTDKSVRCVKD